MKLIVGIERRIIALVLLVFIPTLNTMAQVNAADDSTHSSMPYIIFSNDAHRSTAEVDSLFFLNSLPIVFPVSKTIVSDTNPELRHFIEYALPILRSSSITNPRIRVRSAASPEGPLWFNQQLSRGRRDALLKIFRNHGVSTQNIQIDVVDEEYELLAFFMRQVGDPDATLVTNMVNRHLQNPALLKKMLQEYDGGRLWDRLLKEYFPPLRASRFMIILPDNTLEDLMASQRMFSAPDIDFAELRPSATMVPLAIVPQSLWTPLTPASRARREVLAIKTNLLEWGAWVPQYGMCPMPNVELEFYPRHGHFTVGGNFDCPWWIGNTTNHKYFELRNYQLYTRFYVRNSNRSYSDAAHTVPTPGQAAFRGFYLQAYAHAFLYQIGFSAKKGWIGEGLGGGLGLGYVLPISRDGHWRLDMGVQVGMFRTKYDPFVWGKPVFHGGEIDGQYYYNTHLYRDNFEKRLHRYTWMGPTRVGLSLSYDLLYHKNNRRGVSFRKKEKGGSR